MSEISQDVENVDIAYKRYAIAFLFHKINTAYLARLQQHKNETFVIMLFALAAIGICMMTTQRSGVPLSAMTRDEAPFVWSPLLTSRGIMTKRVQEYTIPLSRC
jgi:hypothetical protein